MIKAVKRRLRINRIKKEAMQPRVQNATMEDIQRKLENYSPERQEALNAERSISVQFLQ